MIYLRHQQVILLLLLLLVPGCIYIPVPLKPSIAGGPILPDLLGDEHSCRALHVGVSKAKVLAVLGPPLAQTSDGQQLGYSLGYLRGYWVGLMIRISDGHQDPFDEPRYRVYSALLMFDGNDNLKSYQLVHDDQRGGIPDTMAISSMMGEVAKERQMEHLVRTTP